MRVLNTQQQDIVSQHVGVDGQTTYTQEPDVYKSNKFTSSRDGKLTIQSRIRYTKGNTISSPVEFQIRRAMGKRVHYTQHHTSTYNTFHIEFKNYISLTSQLSILYSPPPFLSVPSHLLLLTQNIYFSNQNNPRQSHTHAHHATPMPHKTSSNPPTQNHKRSSKVEINIIRKDEK